MQQEIVAAAIFDQITPQMASGAIRPVEDESIRRLAVRAHEDWKCQMKRIDWSEQFHGPFAIVVDPSLKAGECEVHGMSAVVCINPIASSVTLARLVHEFGHAGVRSTYATSPSGIKYMRGLVRRPSRQDGASNQLVEELASTALHTNTVEGAGRLPTHEFVWEERLSMEQATSTLRVLEIGALLFHYDEVLELRREGTSDWLPRWIAKHITLGTNIVAFPIPGYRFPDEERSAYETVIRALDLLAVEIYPDLDEREAARLIRDDFFFAQVSGRFCFREA